MTGARPPDTGSASPRACAASVSRDTDRCSISLCLLFRYRAEVISRDDIRRCYDTIRPYIRRTPVIGVRLGELDESAAALPAGTLELEQLQCAGAFKARGAFTNLLLREVPAAGGVAASGGNHGVAVAYAAHRLGVPAKIFVPTVSAPTKIERIRQLGADLVVTGERYADAL